MNGIEAKAPVEDILRSVNGGLFSDARKVVVFAVLAALYLLPFMRVVMGTDEGLLVYGSVRIVQGQVFARDFFEIVGPGTLYWVALFFKVFGVSFVVAHACLFLTSLGTAVLMFILSRRICNLYQTLPCVVIAATSFGAIWPTISHHVDSNLVALLAVSSAVLWVDRGSSVLLFVTGIADGVTVWVHLPKGIYLMIALLVWVFVQRKQRPYWVRNGLLLLGGCGVVVGLGSIYFASQHALWDVFNATFLWPSQHYGGANTVPYGSGIVSTYWNLWSFGSSELNCTKILAGFFIIPFLLVAALPVLLPVLGVSDWRKLLRPDISLFWLCGWAMWLSEYHRKEICHLVFGSPLLILLAVYYLQRMKHKLAGYGLQILMMSGFTLAIANLGLVLVAHATPTRVGTVAMFKADPVIAQMEARIPVGEEVLVYPSNPVYYFLTRTKNPIRWGGLMYNYNSQADFQSVVAALERDQVKFVVWDTGFMEQNLRVIFPSAKTPSNDQLIVEPYLETHYRTVWEDRGVRIMERGVAEDGR